MSKSKLKSKQKRKKEHGGSLAVGRRRRTRPLNIKLSHHITMKSHHAIGKRSLFRHKKLILSIIHKNSFYFHVKVYEYAIQGNHLHLLVKAQTREGLQNFFRVVAGHCAQKILELCPLKLQAGGAPDRSKGCLKNQRKFWSYLLYSRIVAWGREFKTVTNYIQKNTLELLQIIAYQPRQKKNKTTLSDSPIVQFSRHHLRTSTT
jgi:REP element-mobilizing transposase RayT